MKVSNSACILQERACLLWSGGQEVTTRWPPVAAKVSGSGESVKKKVFCLASWNQVWRMTASRLWWNCLLVFTEMKIWSCVRRPGPGRGKVDWILLTRRDWDQPGSEWTTLCFTLLESSLGLVTRVRRQMITTDRTKTPELIWMNLWRF